MSLPSPDGESRWAVVLADAAGSAAAPPGIDGRAYALAMCEDVIELVGDLSIVTTAVLCVDRGDPRWLADVSELAWPGTVIAGTRSSSGAAVLAALDLALSHSADAAVVVASDVPDLPGLLLGKLFRALGSADIAVSVTDAGELAALASRLPWPEWLEADCASLDVIAGTTALDRLRSAAPEGQVVAAGPGWHRLRAPADVRRLDPGLEGWSSTRALLSAPARG